MVDKNKRPRPAVLMILDGFGVAPDSDGNAITRADTPVFDMLTSRYPTMTLRASGETVGLPWGEMGNSEVGHLTIGSGRINYQDLPKIDKAIEDGSFFKNEAFLNAINHAKKNNGTLHVVGVFSSGNVHGSVRHANALLDLAKEKGVKDLAVHVILDGRDSIYNAGIDFIEALEQKLDTLRLGKITSISGRYYAMDRDHRWDRVQKAYNAIALGVSDQENDSPLEALRLSYANEVYDEEFVPTVIRSQKKEVKRVKEGDAMIFFNFRADRARELVEAFSLPSFMKFKRDYIDRLYITTMTDYEEGLPVEVAFPLEKIDNTLCEVIAQKKLVQLHIAETEKYAHITYFLNGKTEEPHFQEDRIIIPSPAVSRYDTTPEMSACIITERVLKEIKIGNYDVIFINFSNADMVAHTGNMDATVKAVEVMDECVGKIVKEVLKKGGFLMITSDHGNAEELKNLQTGGINKEHSTNPVPLWIVSNEHEGQSAATGDVPVKDLARVPPIGILADVAPTFLSILGIDPAKEMTGSNLL